MNNDNPLQVTIGKEIELEGVGLHTGNKSKLTFRPAPANTGAGKSGQSLAMNANGSRLVAMNAPVDIELIKGRRRAEDMRRLKAGEVTPEELQRENSFIWSAADILHVDLNPKGTEESWARIMHNLQQNSESI